KVFWRKVYMSDNKLKLLLRGALAFLLVSVVFCIFAVCHNNSQKKYMEQQRLSNETKLAELQMPTVAPEQESDNITNTENTVEAIVLEGDSPVQEAKETVSAAKAVIVLDAGHGKSSSEMSEEEKKAEGYVYNEEKGSWGEWRHYKNGTFGDDCGGSGCTQTAPPNGSCWYPMGNGDRDTEPSINLNNALAAQKYLEQMGYEVRMTRTSNEQNPSMNKRVSYCFPDNDTSCAPDVAAYICIHSNAGGGHGTSYISLGGAYEQCFIPSDYAARSNSLGQLINTKIAAASGLFDNSPIGSEEYLILFNKCPVPIAYMEIGFFDNSSDLEILQSSSDTIGQAIAEGVDEYLKNN
ncbi:MAG: N-acetylmuramoyl-L-alanine amidase, partial [Hominilimicola sp.]